MSADFIIIIIGILFVILAAIARIKTSDSSVSLISSKLSIPFGIIGVLLLIYGGYSIGMVTQPNQIEQGDVGNTLEVQYPIESVQVISPVEGDSVECRILTMGVYPDGHEKDIWVLLKPTDNKYYPQSDHTNTSFKRSGEWQVLTRFGGDQDEVFEVIVYETDLTASQYFSATIANWKAEGAYPGLEDEDLPKGAIEVDRIKVSLKKNCRGVHDN